MADSKAVSRYVKSLLNLAVSKGVLEEVHADMKSFDKVLAENRAAFKCIEKSYHQALQKEKCFRSAFSWSI